MSARIRLDKPLSWRQIAAVAEGASLALSDAARGRIAASRALVESIVAKRIRAYGVNTGVGALCDVVVDEPKQRQLSRNIVMSHAVGVGPPLAVRETRAIVAAAVNNFALGYSGIGLSPVERLMQMLSEGCVPEVPVLGSVGYLSHMAHIALVLLGSGHALLRGERCSGAEALRVMGLQPLVLEAKEGLSLVNGTPCATGLSAVALRRLERVLDWADAIAAMTFENLGAQAGSFDSDTLSARVSAGVAQVGARLRSMIHGSGLLAARAGRHTQDPLSLRAVPQVHGAARDLFAHAEEVVDRELASATDNPIVTGTVDAPHALSEAHAVGAAIGITVDALATAAAEVAAMSERRLDRLVNPLLSNLPAFLATDSGVGTGFMIAQYTAVSLVGENRRLAAPASLDGGITSGLQEDHLSHATPAAIKLLKILDNAEIILGVELLAAAQAYELQPDSHARAAGTDALYRRIRAAVAVYRDDRPLAEDIDRARELIRNRGP
jgi:histidine ammonia-lyase